MFFDTSTIQKLKSRGLAMEELPYFRFYPAEWIMGDITLCSLSAQGLFTNILSFYWTKDCCITEAMLKHRFSQALTELEELLKHGIIKVKNDKKTIEIKFLNNQYRELRDKRKKLQDAGRKGGKRSKPPSSQALSQAKATPKHLEEKRYIKEEKRKDNILDVEENAKKILTELNQATGRNHTDNGIIIENLLNGKTAEQHMHIIAVKRHDPWFISHPNLMKPSTLFGERFGDYLNEKIEDFKMQKKGGLQPMQDDGPPKEDLEARKKWRQAQIDRAMEE